LHLKPDSRPGSSPGASSESLPRVAAGSYDAELRLIVEQAQMLTQASGAAIALRQGDLMVCRARAGATAPDLGAQLDTRSGLSGECVRSARTLVCGDTESDPRVNLDVCRYLGIRSIAVLPICLGEEAVGVFEAFSAQPGAFTVNEVAALESMRDLVISVIRPAPELDEISAAALAARAALFDPQDDLMCELEQRPQAQPEVEPLQRAFELVKRRAPQSAAPAPPSPATPPANASSRTAASAPFSAPSAPAPRPAAPAPPTPAAAHPGRESSRIPAAPVFRPPAPPAAPAISLPPRAPAASAPAGFVSIPDADPEDDLVCEIEMRAPGRSILHPAALSTFSPAPHRPPEHVISRKLIVAGVIVALVGLMWLRWCNHAQPAAQNPPPANTVQASTAPPPAAPVPDTAAPAAAAPVPQEASPQSDAPTPPPAEAAPASPPVRHAPGRHSAAAPRHAAAKTASARPAQTGAAAPRSRSEPSPATVSPSAPLQAKTISPPPLATAAPAQPSPPAFTLKATPAAPQPPASSGELSLSQAVVTAAPQAASGKALSPDALKLLLDSAQQGDGGAQLALAVRYANGDGVRQSYPEALKWFTRARAKGVAPTEGAAVEAWMRVQQWAQSRSGR
jgi:hypothetical protein